MKKAWLLLLVVIIFSCDENQSDPGVEGCTVEATVVDLTGLDGCGIVFELNDGTRLDPVRLAYCGTPPLPKEVLDDPLFGFEFVNGKKVLIGYEKNDEYMNACMAGHLVKITCITEVAGEAED